MMPLLPATRTIRTPEQLDEMVEYYTACDEFVFDVETVGEHRGIPAHNRVTWVSLASGKRCDAIPLGHPHGDLLRPGSKHKEPIWDPRFPTMKGAPRKKWVTVEKSPLFGPRPRQLRPSEFFSAMEPLFFSDRRKVGHNLKFDLESITKYYGGRVPPPPYGDTLVAAWLLLPENDRKGLKELTSRFYGIDYQNAKVGAKVEEHGFHDVATYACLDAAMTWMLWTDLQPRLDAHDMETVFNLEMEILYVLAHMETHGVCIDTTPMQTMASRLQDEAAEVTKRLWKVAGEKLNLDAQSDKRKLLFDILGHEPITYTAKTHEPQVTKDVLEKYSFDPVVQDLLEYNRIQKMFSTYVGDESALVKSIIDGRVHTDFVSYGTATGRFSSRRPNLQNIPSRGDEAKLLRSFFVAGPDETMVVADYGQIEYRVLAHFCQDPTLVDAFEQGYDPHAAVIALILGKPVEEVTKEERDVGKTFNFAAIYGAGDNKLAGTLGITVEQVKSFRYKYIEMFPQVEAWKRETIKGARKAKPVPHVVTLLGRRRLLPELNYSDDGLRMGAERKAVNSRVQGSAADIIKMAMVEVHRLKPAHWNLVLTVHDELAMTVPVDEAEDAKNSLSKWMLSVNPLTVPLEADAAVGQNWAEAKEAA